MCRTHPGQIVHYLLSDSPLVAISSLQTETCIFLDCGGNPDRHSENMQTPHSLGLVVSIQNWCSQPLISFFTDLSQFNTILHFLFCLTWHWFPSFCRTKLRLQGRIPNSHNWEDVHNLPAVSHQQASTCLNICICCSSYVTLYLTVCNNAILTTCFSLQAVTKDGYACISCPGTLSDEGKCQCPQGNVLGEWTQIYKNGWKRNTVKKKHDNWMFFFGYSGERCQWRPFDGGQMWTMQWKFSYSVCAKQQWRQVHISGVSYTLTLQNLI